MIDKNTIFGECFYQFQQFDISEILFANIDTYQ